MFLASIGTYGLLSYMVTERRREIGIRMALGAERGCGVATHHGQGLRLALFGLAAGLAGAFALTRLMATLLFDVEPNDPATLIAVAAAITGVAALACFIPAQRATRVDPVSCCATNRGGFQTSSPNQPRRATHFTASSTGTTVNARTVVSIQSAAVRLNVPNAR